MDLRKTRCDPQAIERSLTNRLNDEEQSALEDHLEDCPSCRQSLEARTANPDWWHEARSYLASARPTEDDGEPADFHTPPSEETEEFAQNMLCGLRGYLAPTDDPRMLGRLGAYEITGIVGSGGMGVVLKGLDPALLRYVAIKVLSPQLATCGAARQRFAREARAAAAVVHDNVMAIHAVAEANGLPYLVMPYVSGPSLEKRLQQSGALPTEEVLRIGRQVAAGLAAAHAQGLVHRDVKPANILLEEGIARVKITDFGLARAVDDASLTQSGVIAGTPQYMSPEQARGESVDHRSDLFSLGSVLYAMCVGHPPFRAETAYGILRRVEEQESQPIRELNSTIPGWLVEVIAKLHRKAPSERFQSASELESLLEGCLAHLQLPDAIPLPEPVRISVPSNRASRRRVGWLAACSAVLATGGFVCWETRGRFFAPPAGESAIRESEEGTTRLPEDDNPERRIEEIRRGAAGLEAELQQRTASRLGDPDQAVLRDVRKRLQALQQELGAEAP
jgi:serine/threonine protein kinase